LYILLFPLSHKGSGDEKVVKKMMVPLAQDVYGYRCLNGKVKMYIPIRPGSNLHLDGFGALKNSIFVDILHVPVSQETLECDTSVSYHLL